MAIRRISTDTLTDIANAIREKEQSTLSIPTNEMAERILNISGGTTSIIECIGLPQSGSAYATKNGNTINGVWNYEKGLYEIIVTSFGTWNITYTNDGITNTTTCLVEDESTYQIDCVVMQKLYWLGDLCEENSGGWSIPPYYDFYNYDKWKVADLEAEYIHINTDVDRFNYSNRYWYKTIGTANLLEINQLKSINIEYESNCDTVYVKLLSFDQRVNDISLYEQALSNTNGQIETTFIDVSSINTPYKLCFVATAKDNNISYANIKKVWLERKYENMEEGLF